jgi:hypothetical protein
MDVARPEFKTVVRAQVLSLSIGLAGLLLLTVRAAAKQPDWSRPQTGIPQSGSLYGKMRDGMQIAVSLSICRKI